MSCTAGDSTVESSTPHAKGMERDEVLESFLPTGLDIETHVDGELLGETYGTCGNVL